MIFSDNTEKLELTGNELKKYRQKKKILELLYQHDSLSGTVLSKKIGISIPTTIALLNELSQMGYVKAWGTGASSGGRKPVMFRLLNESIYIIACELGRYKGKIIIYNSHNQPVTSLVYFDTSIDDDELVEKIYTNAQNLINEYQINEYRIYGIGLTMPGLVDEVKGINYTIKNKKFYNVKERLEARFNKMVYINNDARMQAHGEYVFGKAKGHSNVVIVNWNWGIGMGMIINGQLYNGASGFAGELSHIKITDDGELCICGKRGCLETIASTYVMVRKAVQGINSDVISQLTINFKDHINDLQPEDIINAAKQGDEFSISLLTDLGLALGKGLALVIQLLNPEIIVLGGTVSQANRFVLTPIQQSLNKYCLDQLSANVKIVISDNWEQAGLLGVTAILYQKLFSDKYERN